MLFKFGKFIGFIFGFGIVNELGIYSFLGKFELIGGEA